MATKSDPKDKKLKDDSFSIILAMIRKREKEENEARERYLALAYDPTWNKCTEENKKRKMRQIVEMSTLKKTA